MRPCRNEFEPEVGFVVMAARNAAIRVAGDDAGTSSTRPPDSLFASEKPGLEKRTRSAPPMVQLLSMSPFEADHSPTRGAWTPAGSAHWCSS